MNAPARRSALLSAHIRLARPSAPTPVSSVASLAHGNAGISSAASYVERCATEVLAMKTVPKRCSASISVLACVVNRAPLVDTVGFPMTGWIQPA
mmetsp:Transcript_41529/g.69230  ORF Transcript_41529/g.69230 Transcript_41529/m.69230 type:complete len:95 (+) Transcript_41529:4178-4462(+)